MSYDVDYFIKKFEAIPDSKWCVGNLEDRQCRHCALGHCGETGYGMTIEGEALYWLLPTVDRINDGETFGKGKHPRTRILNALRDLKRKAEP